MIFRDHCWSFTVIYLDNPRADVNTKLIVRFPICNIDGLRIEVTAVLHLAIDTEYPLETPFELHPRVSHQSIPSI